MSTSALTLNGLSFLITGEYFFPIAKLHCLEESYLCPGSVLLEYSMFFASLDEVDIQTGSTEDFLPRSSEVPYFRKSFKF